LQLRGVRPFLSSKYDLTKHPHYYLTGDCDKKNLFDIEKFLNRQMKLIQNDMYVVIDGDNLG
jgi:type IV secretion system protein VirD4